MSNFTLPSQELPSLPPLPPLLLSIDESRIKPNTDLGSLSDADTKTNTKQGMQQPTLCTGLDILKEYTGLLSLRSETTMTVTPS